MNIPIKKTISQLMILGILMVVSFCIVMNSPLNIWLGTDIGTDSSVFKYVGYEMMKGQVPYKDTFDHKGPILYLINYFSMYLATWKGIWIIEFGVIFFTLIGLYKIVRLKCSKLMTLLVLSIITTGFIFFYVGGNTVEEYALPFITISLYIFLDYYLNNTVNILRLIVCGASCAVVFMLRPNMISTWICFGLGIIIVCIKNRMYCSLKKFILFFVIGFGIVVLPILGWLGYNGALHDFFDCYIVFNLEYSASPFVAEYAGIENRIKGFWKFLSYDLSILVALVLLYSIIKKRNILIGTYGIYFFSTLCLMVMAGRSPAGYGLILIPIYAYPCSLLGKDVEKDMRGGGDTKVQFCCYI